MFNTENEKILLRFLSAEIPRGESNLRVPVGISSDDDDTARSLKRFINQIIDSEHLIVLAGSGTSLTFNLPGEKRIAPSMADLWDICRNNDQSRFDLILHDINYDAAAPAWPDGSRKNDIELLLSMCDAYLELGCLSNQRQNRLRNFLTDAKNLIRLSTDFTSRVPAQQWSAHNRFIRVLAMRSPKQKRLKLFTTNYDLAFETTASNTGMIVIDGFEFSNPSRFNPAWFNYDIVNRSHAFEKGSSYLSNIFHLYKIHGSVDWMKTAIGIEKRSSSNSDGEPIFIYPSSSKYQNSYDAPYLDMMAAFLDSLQKPKTALICIGFGFNDKHLNNAITMALRTNPEFLLAVVTKDVFDTKGSFNSQIRNDFNSAIQAGDSRLAIIDSTFETFSNFLPDRHIASPETEIFKLFEKVVHGGAE